jgi:tripartite-type tricarboxylate transporter receptor subunit TctC
MRIPLAALTLALGSNLALAANLPCSQVRLIVPYAAGGAADVAARIVGERLAAALDKNVVIETRTGATGNIGTLAVINSTPDGCTLLVNAAVIATFPFSFSKLGYDPIKDLAPVAGIGITPTLVVTASANPANNLAELIKTGKASAKGLNFSTAGYGLLQHLAVEEIAQRTGATFTHVPYKGGAQAATDLVTGEVDFGSVAAGSILPLVKEGRLKPLAVIQERRSALVPAVPTTAEQGLPVLNAGVHFMLYAPGGTPGAIVDLLSAEVSRIVGDPRLKERFANVGFDPTPISAHEAAAVMRKTGEDWAPVIKRLNIRLD